MPEANQPIIQSKERQKKSKALRNALEQYAKMARQDLLRYNHALPGLIEDIQSNMHIEELCDAFALQSLLLWISTRFDDGMYAEAIVSAPIDSENELESFLHSECIYPFNFEAISYSKELREKMPHWLILDDIWRQHAPETHSTWLDQSIYSLHLSGVLYEAQNSILLAGSKDEQEQSSLSLRKSKGQFYTPLWVVRQCFDECLEQSSIALIKEGLFRILDPSCGSGNFLIGALSAFADKGLNAEQLARSCRMLYGRDNDGRAVCLARHAMRLTISTAAKEQGLEISSRRALLLEAIASSTRNLQVTDSIYESALDKKDKFELVITNPPYKSFGSRAQEKLPDSTARFLKDTFRAAEYKIRLSSIFQEIALGLLKAGGRACLLVPDAFMTGKQFYKLRETIEEKASIESLFELPDDTIAGAVVGRWCIAVYKRKGSQKKNREYVKLARINFDAGGIAEIRRNRAALTSLQWGARKKLLLLLNKEEEFLIEILRAHPFLGSILRGHTGIRARGGQSSIIDSKAGDARLVRGITSGAAVEPYRVNWAGNWLDINPDRLYAGGFDKRIIEPAKLLVRQTGDRIIAAVDQSGLYHLNNVHAFSTVAKGKSAEKYEESRHLSLLFLIAALMNSRLWLFLYRLLTREKNRALAQIDIDLIEEMPLPPILEFLSPCANLSEDNLLDEIAELSRVAHEEMNGKLRLDCQDRIDSLIFQAYLLPAELVEHIEKHCI